MSLIKVDPKQSRGYTRAVLRLLDDGVLDEKTLVHDLLNWMSEADVKGFCESPLRELFEDESEEEEE